MQQISFLHSSKFLWFIVLWSILNLLINNGAISLWDQDESAYAGFAYTMLETGNWSIPDFLWSEPHRKTPLHFWSIAVSFAIIGVNEFALRFPSALAVFLTATSIYYLGRNVFGRDTSLLASIMVLSSLFLTSLGKIAVTDALLILFETIAVLAIFNHYEKPSWKWFFILWMAVAGGLLVKGPPILILTLGVLGWLWIFHKKHWRWVSLHPWVGLPLALVPLFWWGRVAWLSDGGVFINWLLDWYIFKRASGETAFGQWGPPTYFLLVFFVAFLPFATFFPAAIGSLFKKFFTKNRENFYLYLMAWCVSGWFFYELIPSKLPAYAMGAYGAIAILLAKQITELNAEDFQNKKIYKFGRYLFLVFIFIIAIGLPVAAAALLSVWGIVAASITSLFVLGLGLYTFNHQKRNNLESAYKGSIFLGLTFVLFAWILVIPAAEHPRSATKRIAEKIGQEFSEETQVVFARPFYLPSLPFYVAQNNQKYISLSEEEFDKVFDFYESNEKTVIVFDEQKYQLFEEKLKEKNYKEDPELIIIEGWVSDMGKLVEYKILKNLAFKK